MHRKKTRKTTRGMKKTTKRKNKKKKTRKKIIKGTDNERDNINNSRQNTIICPQMVFVRENGRRIAFGGPKESGQEKNKGPERKETINPSKKEATEAE